VQVEIENTFRVAANPDRVYGFLLDVNSIAGCVPGAQLSEVVDPSAFRGKVKIKVGPVTVSYDGVARIVARDESERSAVLEAEGRETTGSGSARATTRMAVEPDGEASLVRFSTEFSVVGRVAQFGRGIMEDVSKRLVEQMAGCIRERLEGGDESQAPQAAATASPADGSAEVTGRSARDEASRPGPGQGWREPQEPAAINALALAGSVAADRLRRVKLQAVLGAVIGVVLAIFLLRRRRR
jgi:carbon monoxide dehydrogenase subunit G